jgi:hypothetical protein
MTKFEKNVLKLLTLIWRAVMMVPGTFQYSQDEKFVSRIEKEVGID